MLVPASLEIVEIVRVTSGDDPLAWFGAVVVCLIVILVLAVLWLPPQRPG